MGLAVERLPLTLHWKKLYISGRSNDNDNLLGIDYGSSHIVALQRSSERRPLVQVESRNQTRLVSAEAKPNDGCSQKQSKEKNGASRFLSLPMKKNNRLSAVSIYKARAETLCG